jgi:hypothetical protein
MGRFLKIMAVKKGRAKIRRQPERRGDGKKYNY